MTIPQLYILRGYTVALFLTPGAHCTLALSIIDTALKVEHSGLSGNNTGHCILGWAWGDLERAYSRMWWF